MFTTKGCWDAYTGLPLRFGHPQYAPSKVFLGINVRISDDVRRMVFFLGTKDNTPGSSGIHCKGTAFLIAFEDYQYFVTVKHVALGLGDAPFLARFNKKNGESENLDVDVGDIRWFLHPDPNVDLAVVPFHYDLKSRDYDALFGAGLEQLTPEICFECGDLCYTIGLFQLLAGKKRNLPVVHSGSLALLPSEEKIPVRDWDNPHDSQARKYVEGYLVQQDSIQGLSGAPVFARSYVELTDLPVAGTKVPVLLPKKDVVLLGIWQGAWDGKADAVRATMMGYELRVPVGMGVVIPAYKLVELLQMPEVKQHRDGAKKAIENRAATLDSVPTSVISETVANPHHLEDFKRLVDVAARKRPQGDQT